MISTRRRRLRNCTRTESCNWPVAWSARIFQHPDTHRSEKDGRRGSHRRRDCRAQCGAQGEGLQGVRPHPRRASRQGHRAEGRTRRYDVGGEAVSAPPTLNSSWAALSRPPIAPTSVGACGVSCRADARPMGGRVKPGHDGLSFIFNHIKIYDVIVFLFQNSYPYWADDLERQHAPDSPVIAAALARRTKSRNNFIAVGPDRGNRKGAGARPGNMNAFRHGADTGAWRTLVADLRRYNRDVRRLLAIIAAMREAGYRSERSRRIPALDCSASRTAFVCGGAQ